MPWDFPRKVPHAGETISFQDFNDGILQITEMDGNLGEQNWSSALASGTTRKDDLADDVSLRVAHAFADIDIAATAESASISAVTIPATGSWETVELKNVLTRGGELLLLGSIQIIRPNPSETATGTVPVTYRDYIHVQVGFRVNGAPYPVLAIGDQDDLEEGENMELGLQGWSIGAVVEGVVPTPAGQNAVELVVRAIPSRAFDAQDKDARIQVTSRDFIVVESW